MLSPEYNEDGRVMRRVRSFVRRQGRSTKRQEDALEKNGQKKASILSMNLLILPKYQ